jgi:hypothetical protein
MEISPELIDVAWGNYFGAGHGYQNYGDRAARTHAATL